MAVIHFPAWRGTIVEIVDALIHCEADGMTMPGFAVDIRNHPKLGDFHVWHGFSFDGAVLEALEMLALLPGAELLIDCEEPEDDDPGGGEILAIDIAA